MMALSSFINYIAVLIAQTAFNNAYIDHKSHDDDFSKYFSLRAIQPVLYLVCFILSFFLTSLTDEEEIEEGTIDEQ